MNYRSLVKESMVLVGWKKYPYTSVNMHTPQCIYFSRPGFHKFWDSSPKNVFSKNFYYMCVYMYISQVENISLWSHNLNTLNTTHTHIYVYKHWLKQGHSIQLFNSAVCKHTVPIHCISLIDGCIFHGHFSAEDKKFVEEETLFLIYTKLPYGRGMALDSYLPRGSSLQWMSWVLFWTSL